MHAGEAGGWIGTFTDIDEQKRAHEQSEAAILLRDEFMSVASHELRTPLSALQLQLQGLHRLLQQKSSTQLDECAIEKKIAFAVRQTDRLSKLINSLLDVSRIQTGKLELQAEEVDLAEVAAEVVERMEGEANRVGCALNLELEGTTGTWDRLRLEQVIFNLLTNAMKYAPGKPITIQVTSDADDNAILSIHDEGIGIEAEHLQRIFERFERAVPTRHYGGLGLGLYIVSQIVRAHGGSIGVQSSPGGGATFTVRLPKEPSLEHGISCPQWGELAGSPG